MTASETHKNKTWPCKETMNEDPTAAGEYIYLCFLILFTFRNKKKHTHTHLNGASSLFSSKIYLFNPLVNCQSSLN